MAQETAQTTTNTTPQADPKAAPAVDPKAEPTSDYTVNGKVVKLTASQAKAYVQKGYFADQRLKSMDALKVSSEKVLTALKSADGIMGLLKDPALGVSPKEVLRKLLASDAIDDEVKEDLSKWVYQNVVQKAKLTPEQIENEKKLTDYERLKKAETDRKASEQTAQQKAQKEGIYKAVRSEVTKQILADKTFPQTEGSIRAVVEKLRVMNKKGAGITAENVGKALELVKKDHILHQQTMLDAIENPEDLIALVGEARALKISKALVARLQAKNKAKVEGKPKADEVVREKTTEIIDRKLGRNKYGYSEMDLTRKH